MRALRRWILAMGSRIRTLRSQIRRLTLKSGVKTPIHLPTLSDFERTYHAGTVSGRLSQRPR